MEIRSVLRAQASCQGHSHNKRQETATKLQGITARTIPLESTESGMIRPQMLRA